MPFVNKNRPKHYHTTWFGFRFNKTRVFAGPDIVNSITIPWFQKRKTIWERKR